MEKVVWAESAGTSKCQALDKVSCVLSHVILNFLCFLIIGNLR